MHRVEAIAEWGSSPGMAGGDKGDCVRGSGQGTHSPMHSWIA